MDLAADGRRVAEELGGALSPVSPPEGGRMDSSQLLGRHQPERLWIRGGVGWWASCAQFLWTGRNEDLRDTIAEGCPQAVVSPRVGTGAQGLVDVSRPGSPWDRVARAGGVPCHLSSAA
jgi:hypothetical protein